MAAAEVNDAIRRRLVAAREGGEVVTVRYRLGRRYRYTFAATGTVEGFVHRPREMEKARIRRAPHDLIGEEVPLGAIVAVEGQVKRGERL